MVILNKLVSTKGYIELSMLDALYNMDDCTAVIHYVYRYEVWSSIRDKNHWRWSDSKKEFKLKGSGWRGKA